ncbi:DNA polymerase IV [Streptomyces violarus]
MTILCVRFQLPPTREADLPRLLGMLEEFTPVVQALPPDGALADLRGAERYFGRGAVELASVIRVRSLALYGVDCVIGAGPGPMLARVALRDAVPGVTCAVPEGQEAIAEFLADKPVAALPGVGAATARTLGDYGLDTLGRVAAAPLSTLQRLIGAKAGRDCTRRRTASTAAGSYRTPSPAPSPRNAPSTATNWTRTATAAPCCRPPRISAPGCAPWRRSAARSPSPCATPTARRLPAAAR